MSSHPHDSKPNADNSEAVDAFHRHSRGLSCWSSEVNHAGKPYKTLDVSQRLFSGWDY